MGNHHFAKGEYDSAVQLYTLAIDKSQESKNDEALVLNLCNRSACLYKMERYEESRTDALQAVQISNGKNVKASFRWQRPKLHSKSIVKLTKRLPRLHSMGSTIPSQRLSVSPLQT